MEDHARAIWKSYNDPAPWLVYADWLTGRGDPRGELIVVQHQLETAKGDAKKKLQTRERALLKSFPIPANVTIEWHRGFWQSIAYTTDDHQEPHDAKKIATEIFESPSAAFAIELKLGLLTWGNSREHTAYLDVAGGRVGQHIRRMELGWGVEEDDIDNAHYEAGELAVLKKFPKLRRLTMYSGLQSFPPSLGLATPELRELRVETSGLSRKNLKSIVADPLRKLESLHLWFGDPSRSSDIKKPKELDPLLAGTAVPGLKKLGLMNTVFSDALCAVLPKARILRQLDSLDLSMGIMSKLGADAIAREAAAFRHLAWLNVGDNFLEPADLKALRAALPSTTVVSKDQKEPYDDDPDEPDAGRYVSVHE